MNKHKFAIFISITLLLLGFVVYVYAELSAGTWEKLSFISSAIALFLGTSGSIISIFIPSSYIHVIQPSDWIVKGKEWYVEIPAKKHGMGKHAKIAISQLRTDGNWEIVMCGSNTNANGDISIEVAIEIDCTMKAVIS